MKHLVGRRPLLWGGLAALGLVATGCSGTAANSDSPVVVNDAGDSDGWTGTRLNNPYQVPNVSLTDTSGQSYNLKTSPSTPVTLVFFGYTNCPDVCIAVLSDLAIALKRSDQSVQDSTTVVFVTTDPARDNPKTIRAYLDRFDPRFVGLTTDLDTIKSVAQSLGVLVEGMQKLPSGGYEVGHGAQVIGVTESEGVIIWTPSTPVSDLKSDLARLVAEK